MSIPPQPGGSARVNFYVTVDQSVKEPIVDRKQLTIYPLTSAINFTEPLEDLQDVGQYKIYGALKVN